MSTFTTHRKTTLLLPKEIKAEIRREILRTPKYWAEKVLSLAGFFLRTSVYGAVLAIALSMFLALYSGKLDWHTFLHVEQNFPVPLLWAYLLMLPVFCMMAVKGIPEDNVYEQYFARAVEKRYGNVLHETVMLEELFAAKFRRDRTFLPDDETIYTNVVNRFIPPGSPPGYIRTILKEFKEYYPPGNFETIKRILKKRGIDAEDYLPD